MGLNFSKGVKNSLFNALVLPTTTFGVLTVISQTGILPISFGFAIIPILMFCATYFVIDLFVMEWIRQIFGL